MRRDVLELREFYAGRLGQAARAVIQRKLAEAWGDAGALDVMGLGYATPYLEDYLAHARRTVAVMPAAQGVEVWPHTDAVLACLAEDQALPFPNALFDRILVIHALEEAENPPQLMREVWRVLAPAGRVIVAAANRRGVWCNAESTPLGHGQPFTRGQLETLVRDAQLEPVAWSRALFAPPLEWTSGWADGFEQVGQRLWPAFSGVILLEAVKQTFAVKPRGRRAPARVFAPGVLAPQPARRTGEVETIGRGRGETRLGALPPNA
ncbi:MAG TPA: methyltransferase domain-containing protein [Caulobacteraceae bacterium]|nr:methyltransferase domain-containing protein [Caulobacteraceae bacterium]